MPSTSSEYEYYSSTDEYEYYYYNDEVPIAKNIPVSISSSDEGVKVGHMAKTGVQAKVVDEKKTKKQKKCYVWGWVFATIMGILAIVFICLWATLPQETEEALAFSMMMKTFTSIAFPNNTKDEADYTAWPRLVPANDITKRSRSLIKKVGDATSYDYNTMEMEAFIDSIINHPDLTLSEMVAQMIQPALNQSISDIDESYYWGPGDQAMYGFGSLLNGGGGWPLGDPRNPGQIKYLSADGVTEYPCYECDTFKTTPYGYARLMEEFHIGNEMYWNEKEWSDPENYPPFHIPFFYATDAVHGHNNILNSTVFPHNVGLGSMRDPELMVRIGDITAKEVSATGMDWTFAPCVTVPRNEVWGRVYEGFSEDPGIVRDYSEKMVNGIQGTFEDLQDPNQYRVLSNIKHWLGDGGTLNGKDRGKTLYNEYELMNIHAPGYFSGLDAGAQIVMASYNSWNDTTNYDAEFMDKADFNFKLHGSKYILTDVLKGQLGFDGLVVTDWLGYEEVEGCTGDHCTLGIKSGIDIFMIPYGLNAQNFYNYTIQDVENGILDRELIVEAFRRILRVKYRAGLWHKESPLGVACHNPQNGMCTESCGFDDYQEGLLSYDPSWTRLSISEKNGVKCGRPVAGEDVLLSDEHYQVAREAVRKSLVLLKNNKETLPMMINSGVKVGVTGSASQDWAKVNGGWTLSWQGGAESNVKTNIFDDDTSFARATHPSMAIKEKVEELGGEFMWDCEYDVDYCVVMIGEDPYAEGWGDVRTGLTMEFRQIKPTYEEDYQTLMNVRKNTSAETSVVTLFYSGRALYVNEEMNASDAFVAAWLPGSAGHGISDVLIGNDDHVFTGVLSRTWPVTKCEMHLNSLPSTLPSDWVAPYFEKSYDQTEFDNFPFPFGYGMFYGDVTDTPQLSLDPRNYGCLVPNPDYMPYPSENHVISGSSPKCLSYSGDSNRSNKPCSCFSTSASERPADDQQECGFESDGLDLLEVTPSTDASGGYRIRTSIAKGGESRSKGVQWNYDDEPKDVMDYYYNDGLVMINITKRSELSGTGDVPPVLAIGMSFFSLPGGDASWVDFSEGYNNLSTGEESSICVPLRCVDGGSSYAPRLWHQVTNVMIETRGSVDFTLHKAELTTNSYYCHSTITCESGSNAFTTPDKFHSRMDWEVIPDLEPVWSDWPQINSIFDLVPTDEVIVMENFIDSIMTHPDFTIAEKFAQTIQPALDNEYSDAYTGSAYYFFAGDLRRLGFGTMLNGGGGWPFGDREYMGIDMEGKFPCPGCNGMQTTAKAYARFMEELHLGNELFWAEKKWSDPENFPPFRIPFMYGVDAVHGHNNAYGATLFPHNVNLGCMGGSHEEIASLMQRMGRATSEEVSAHGPEWTFAPCVTVPRQELWGRVYEGFSEDPNFAYTYAGEVVKGIQGTPEDLKDRDQARLITTVKHWLGDGGTMNGVNEGDNYYSEIDLINIHAPGYFSSLDAGAQSLMTSFNSWVNDANYDPTPADGKWNYTLHGSRYIQRDVLKERMGFDGLIVSDWNGFQHIGICQGTVDCPHAVISGLDVYMNPSNGQAFYRTMLPQIGDEDNERYPIQRWHVEDSTRRILRVKYRLGLWEKDTPLGVACHNPGADGQYGMCSTKKCVYKDGTGYSEDYEVLNSDGDTVTCGRPFAGDDTVLGSVDHYEIAREAVRRSLVLLKNNDKTLPMIIETGVRVGVVGSASKDWSKVNGGWSLNWQGGSDDTVTTDIFDDNCSFPNAKHPSIALEDATVALGGEFFWNCDSSNELDYCIALIGEDPYAEGGGDLPNTTMEFKSMKGAKYVSDYNAVTRARKDADASMGTDHEMKLITMFFSGRSLYTNEEINMSDAFVVAFLPGSAGDGVSDVLIAGQDTSADFIGRLSRSWVKRKCDYNVKDTPSMFLAGWTSPEGIERSYESIANPEQRPFPVGWGFSYDDDGYVPELILDSRSTEFGCLQTDPSEIVPKNDTWPAHGIGTAGMKCSSYQNENDYANLFQGCQCYRKDSIPEAGGILPGCMAQSVPPGISADPGDGFALTLSTIDGEQSKNVTWEYPNNYDVMSYYYDGYSSTDSWEGGWIRVRWRKTPGTNTASSKPIGLGIQYGNPISQDAVHDMYYYDITDNYNALVNEWDDLCVMMVSWEKNSVNMWDQLVRAIIFETRGDMDIDVEGVWYEGPTSASLTTCGSIIEDNSKAYTSWDGWKNQW